MGSEQGRYVATYTRVFWAPYPSPLTFGKSGHHAFVPTFFAAGGVPISITFQSGVQLDIRCFVKSRVKSRHAMAPPRKLVLWLADTRGLGSHCLATHLTTAAGGVAR